MRVFAFATVLGAFFLFVAYFVDATDDPRFRLSVLPCQQQAIYETNGTIDVLILGSSRTKQGVDPHIISRESDAFDNVVNLARSWRGNGQIYHMARDFMNNHDVKRVLVLELSYVSYIDSLSRIYSNGYYPNYALVTKSNDLLYDFFSTPREPYHNRIRDLLQNFIDLVDKRLDLFFSKDRFSGWNLITRSKNDVTFENATTLSCFSRDNDHNSKVLRRKKVSITKSHGDWKKVQNNGWDLSVINNDRHSFYIEQLKNLAREHDIPLVLMLVPMYWEASPSDEFLQKITRKYDLPVITPNNEMRNTLYELNGYSDITHMNQEGRKIFSSWLARELTEILIKDSGV